MMALAVKDQRLELARRLGRWERVHRRQFPWRETRDPYQVLIAELLLQRTPYWKVERIYPKVLRLAPTPQDLGGADPDILREVIRPLGLTRRADSLVALGRALVQRHRGHVPRDHRSLLALPGVGSYVASAVQVFAFGRRVALVDGLTGRVYRRLLALPSSVEPHADRALWHVVEELQPARPRTFHLAVIDLASLVCRLRVPRCAECPLADLCASSGVYAIPETPTNARSRERGLGTATARRVPDGRR